MIVAQKVITFRTLEYPYFGVRIYQTLANIFDEYKINKFIFTITFDNIKSKDKVI